MAIFIGKRPEKWARQVVAALEIELKRSFDVAERGGMTFIFPQEDCGTPREALEVFREATKHLPGATEGFVRPAYIWRGEDMPVRLDDAYVAVFDGKLDALWGDDWTASHPMGGAPATTGIDRS